MHTITPQKLAATLAALAAVGALAVGGTYANFTATPTTIANNAVTAGTVSMSRSGTGAVLTAPALKIGGTASGAVTITNTGTLAARYTLTGELASGSSSTLASALVLDVYRGDATGTRLYGGSLAGLSSVDLGTLAAAGESGSAQTYTFVVSLPTTGSDAGDNALQGLSAATNLTWTAVQA